MHRLYEKELVDVNTKINESKIKLLREGYEKHGILEYMSSLRTFKIENSIINIMTEYEKYLYEQKLIITRIINSNDIWFNIG